MDNTHARRHDPEVAKGTLPPMQHGVAFAVALHLQANIDVQGLRGGRAIHLDAVVDNQIRRNEGVHGGRITAMTGKG